MMKYMSTNTPQFFRVPLRTPDKKARSVGKRSTHWMLRECCRCLQSGPYSQRILYSCINAFQHAGRLVHCSFDRLLCLLPEQVVYILTLVSAEPNRCCWIGYYPLPQGRIQKPAHLCLFFRVHFQFYCNMKYMIYKLHHATTQGNDT